MRDGVRLTDLPKDEQDRIFKLIGDLCLQKMSDRKIRLKIQNEGIKISGETISKYINDNDLRRLSLLAPISIDMRSEVSKKDKLDGAHFTAKSDSKTGNIDEGAISQDRQIGQNEKQTGQNEKKNSAMTRHMDVIERIALDARRTYENSVMIKKEAIEALRYLAYAVKKTNLEVTENGVKRKIVNREIMRDAKNVPLPSTDLKPADSARLCESLVRIVQADIDKISDAFKIADEEIGGDNG